MTTFNKIKQHKGHDIEIVTYGTENHDQNTAVECIDCQAVIIDKEKPK